MKLLLDAYEYFLANQTRFWQAVNQHLVLSLVALAISVLIGVPLGIWIARRVGLAQYVINAFGALRLIPSLAILFLALPYLGTGFRPALFALTVLAFPPVIINTYAGLRGVDRAVVEAAYGMGMAPWQALRRVELPLAMPAIIAGVRIATVSTVGLVTVTALIGQGGLGRLLLDGFQRDFQTPLTVGIVLSLALAVVADLLLLGALTLATPWRRKGRR